MDRISFLPDDFLLHILSLLTTKDVLKTSLLSKRWRNLWKLVHKLEYTDYTKNAADHARFLLFVDRTLVALKLSNVSLADVKFPVSFPLLKVLHLRWVIYSDDETPQKLLSSCLILQELMVDRQKKDNVTTFPITLPLLQRLIYIGESNDEMFELNAPSLKCLEIRDVGYECMIEKMPEIVSANVEVIYSYTDDMLGSLTSLKRLSICLPSESPFPTGKIFHQLVELEFCTCDSEWDLLLSFLTHSPKLRALKLSERHGCCFGEGALHWDEPSSVPETLLSGLETLEWRNCSGWNVEKELATFIV